MNILALVAHPDDVEYMCSGTLMKYRDAGHKIFIALTTSGNTGSNVIPTSGELAQIRESEQLEAAKAYDAEVRFLRFDDEGLLDNEETRRAVLTAIRWANPDVILTHAPQDPSTDHAMTARLTTQMIQSVGGKLHPADLPPIDKRPQIFFCDIAAGINFLPEAYVDISDYMDKKAELIRCHKSQFAWMADVVTSEDFTDDAYVLSRLRGLQYKCKYAEAFTAHRIQGFVADYRLLP